MDDQAPQTPPPGERPTDASQPVPDPHRTEPVPSGEEGMRPGVDPAVRPAQDEPNGPIEGLFKAAGAEAAEEAAELRGERDPEAEALLAQMGVEEEGIESGQLLGLILVVLLSVAALAVVLIYLFIIPLQTQTGRDADASAANYEQEDLRTEAIARLANYSRDGETFGLPIAQAQALVANRYADAGELELPRDRQDWNVSFSEYGAAPAIQSVPDGADPTVYRFRADGVEEVGVDRETGETVDLIENEGGIEDNADTIGDEIEDAVDDVIE